VAAGTFTWIWSLCLFSDDVQFQSYYFKSVRPQNWTQWGILMYAIAFISSLETQASHELIHRREGYNKAIGMFALSKIFYIHFKDEHVAGHHKQLSTFEDTSTSRLNESIYEYMPREIYGTHKSMWKREFQRIRKQHGDDCPTLAFIVFNKMTWYYIVYAIICTTIYLVLGWNSLRFHLIFATFGLWF
jgi:alkane 1-monooxygenase